ncbi:hypothetical protein Tco_0489863 [Tanacetum coccineum]
MSITKEQQQALDDTLVPREQRLTIGSCNYRLSTTFKPKEPTFQVALDVLSLTPFYPAFLITASVPAVYMQEFWATMCSKLHGQKFVDPPFEEEILTFIRELGYPGNIILLSDVKVDMLPQPWKTFGTIINKCLSGKEDLFYQIENKESRMNKYMFYPRFTKVIVNHFMSRDQSIPRRNKIDWNMDNDDPILITMRFIPQHEVVQRYGTVLPEYLTNQAIKESEAYKTYHDLATGKVQPKPKYKKQPALGLETLSEVALTEAKQLKLATKRSLNQTHSSHASGSGAHEGTGKSSDEEYDDDEANVGKDEDDDDHDDDDKQTESDNDDEDFVHPKFITHDDEARQEEVNKEDSFDPRVQTPSHVKSTDDDDIDDAIQGANVVGEEMDEEATNAEGEENELYRDVNVNLEGRDVEMTDAQQTNVQTTQVLEDTHPDTGIDSIFTLNTEATSLVDVPVTTIAEPPLVFATTLPPPPTPLITHILKTLETDFFEFKHTNQFAEAVSSIPDIVDAYLENKMNEAVKKVVQVQSDRLRDEAQAENEDFLNKLNDNIKKIIKNQVKEQVKAQVSKILPKIEKTVNEQLKAEVMTRSSTESKTSLAIAANLSKLELKKILIEKIQSNKDDEDKDEEPSAGSNRGSKRRRAGKEPESTSTPKEKTPKSTEGSKFEFEIGAIEDQPVDETPQPSDWFQKPTRLTSPDCDWNKTLRTDNGPVQPWLSNLAREEGPRESFDELMDTPLDFSAFMMNQIKVDTLTPELLAEVYKATTDQLDWNNPEGQQYPHDLRKPLPLIPNSRDRQVIPFDHFINNDLAYLSGGVSSQTYATSVTNMFSDGTLDDVWTALNDRLKGLGWNIYHRQYGDRVIGNEQKL